MDIINKIKSVDDNDKYNLYKLYEEYSNNYDKNYLDYLFYTLKKYEFNEENNIKKDNNIIEEKIKRLDYNFKKSVKSFYKTCIITNRSQYVCEVAHIYPFVDSELEDKYNPNNGILLCRDLHKLFDDKLIKINPNNYQLILSQEILDDKTLKIYHQYHNKILNIKKESKYYFDKIY